MPTIQVKGLTKKFGGFTAVDNIDLIVNNGEYATLVGPSGCGKTTLLRMISGLLKPTTGDVLLDGKSVVDKPPEDRSIGYLFQNYALFPHMKVIENVGYGPMMHGLSRARSDIMADDMLRLVRLLSWAGYMPADLSGGMQQRVALVRALAAGTRILFLDEPMSSLDPKIGVRLRYEILKMAKKLELTVVHVTHNQVDAMSISDKVIVMKEGRIMQVGPPLEVYYTHVSPYIAHFIGDSNFLEVMRVGLHTASYRGVHLRVGKRIKKAHIVLAIRPGRILFEERLENTLHGVVSSANFLGRTTRYKVDVGGQHIIVQTAKHPEIKKGDKVSIYLPKEDITVFEGFDLKEELRIM